MNAQKRPISSVADNIEFRNSEGENLSYPCKRIELTDFMIDKNNTGNDGIHVGGGKLIDFDFNESFQFNTDHLPAVRPGWYYGVVAIDDGRNQT